MTDTYVVAWHSRLGASCGKQDQRMSRAECEIACQKQNSLYGKHTFFFPSRCSPAPRRVKKTPEAVPVTLVSQIARFIPRPKGRRKLRSAFEAVGLLAGI